MLGLGLVLLFVVQKGFILVRLGLGLVVQKGFRVRVSCVEGF